MNRPTEGMIIVAQGLLGENEEFLVYRWSLPADTKAGATPEAPLQSFFKPTATPPTTTPSPTTAPTPSTASPPVTAPPSTSAPTPPATALMCDQCNAGPFGNALALAGHKTAIHAKKRRVKKPGVAGFSPVSSPSTTPVSTPSTPVSTSSPVAGPVSTSQPSQPTSVAPTEPDSRPITLTASPEQAILPTASAEKTDASPEKPAQGPADSLLAASQIQAPAASQSQALTAPSKEAVKEEIKAVEGASEGSIKYARICGLLAKPLEEFKLHFEANFPNDDMAQALAAANCSIVDNKVVFTGG